MTSHGPASEEPPGATQPPAPNVTPGVGYDGAPDYPPPSAPRVTQGSLPLRIAVISAHTSPLARPGGRKTGGLNVYVRELCERLVLPGKDCSIDIFSRATDRDTPLVTHVAPNLRVIHLRAGPLRYLSSASIYKHLPAFETALLRFVAEDLELAPEATAGPEPWLPHPVRPEPVEGRVLLAASETSSRAFSAAPAAHALNPLPREEEGWVRERHSETEEESELGRRRLDAPYDLVHSHYWLSGLVGQRLKARWRIPHVVMFHTLGEVKNRASHREHESELRIASEATVIAGADRVICATEQERTALRQLYDADPARVEVIPLGVDLDLFHPTDKDAARAELGLDEDQRIVLFVGRIEPLKGLDILINAAAMLESDVDCSVLVVGGDDTARSQVARLRELARERGIEHRVAFVGAVDHDRLPLYYNAADVCVVPSHYESFGLVAVEAMASGVPVVASRVGGLTGTVRDGETGYLIPWLCPEPFAERIELLLDNDSLRRNLGEAAREEVARYRWENVTSAMLKLYGVLTRASAPPEPAEVLVP